MNNEKKDKIIKPEPQAIMPDPKNLRMLAEDFQKSGMFPGIQSLAGFVTVIEAGRELGIPPVSALQTICVVKGRLCMESKAILALAQRDGILVDIIEKTKEKSVVKFTQNERSHTETFTIEDAKDAGIYLDRDEKVKKNWKNYPEEMCYWRCVAKGVRAFSPGVILGLYSKQEIEDIDEPKKPKCLKKAPPAEVVEKQIFDEEEEVEVSDTGLSPQETEQVKEWQGDQEEEEKKDELKLKQQAWKEKEEKEIPPKESPVTLDEPPDQELPFDDKAEIKKIGRDIHLSISQLGITTAKQKTAFLQYLYTHQLAKKKGYLGKDEKGALHFSLGKLEDLKDLYQILPVAAKAWKGEKNG